MPSGLSGTLGLIPGTIKSDSDQFQVLFFGSSWELDGQSTVGLMLYGHGGMNTDYPAATFFGTLPTGVDLSQLFISGMYVHRFRASSNHAFSITPVLVYQAFQIEGTHAFGRFSANPASAVSNNGKD